MVQGTSTKELPMNQVVLSYVHGISLPEHACGPLRQPHMLLANIYGSNSINNPLRTSSFTRYSRVTGTTTITGGETK